MKKSKSKWQIPTKRYDKIKQEIREILTELGVSKRYFKRTMPRVTGSGWNFEKVKQTPGKWGRNISGKKPNIKQQLAMLRDLLELDREIKAEMEEQKENIEKDQATKSAMLDQAGESVGKEELAGLIDSVFDRDH